MAGEYINSKAGKKRIKKQWKSKERKDELHTFKDTTEEYPELEILNTKNLLEGFNSQLKRALRNHNGMKEVNKKKIIDGFLNIKK
ncbi:hypothetical protein CUC04_03435 [Prevotella intermedia]|uniref:Transposase n=1 Tax=Prevotella intermedia TaxID=28131 RepID=A0A2G9IFJ9_PREIN|nr:hypothetical protein [Prevotella intermedia]PIN28529.1 hypothetical protein CUC04_03435 [Prevotella intermedia]